MRAAALSEASLGPAARTTDDQPSSVLRIKAREMGMRTLREDGTRKVLAGVTTADEVIRATVGDVD